MAGFDLKDWGFLLDGLFFCISMDSHGVYPTWGDS